METDERMAYGSRGYNNLTVNELDSSVTSIARFSYYKLNGKPKYDKEVQGCLINVREPAT